MAPERLQGRVESEIDAMRRADMWSVGVLLYTLISGTPPFDAKTAEDLYSAINSGDYSFSGSVWN
jgi:serine/threonine protein kinase